VQGIVVLSFDHYRQKSLSRSNPGGSITMFCADAGVAVRVAARVGAAAKSARPAGHLLVQPDVLKARAVVDAVEGYVKRGKNDAIDAEAICEAMSRPTMRFVPVKTAEQQAALTMLGVRDLLVKQRTMLINALRGHALQQPKDHTR
jgi:Transposase